MKRRWSWRTTGVPGLYTLWCDGRAEVGAVSLLPGYVLHESVVLCEFVDVLERDWSEKEAAS